MHACPDYTHVILIGNNDLLRASEAITRYALGGAGYQDPVDFDMVFEVDAATGFPAVDDNGLPVPNFAPVVEVKCVRSSHGQPGLMIGVFHFGGALRWILWDNTYECSRCVRRRTGQATGPLENLSRTEDAPWKKCRSIATCIVSHPDSFLSLSRVMRRHGATGTATHP